jgi:eukaryotic-like serine/threonine-protein kinase
MKILKFIASKYFWINLGLIILTTVVLALILIGMMKTYTNHNQYITLSDLSGLTLEQVEDHLKYRNLNYEILDTNHYSPDLLPLSVIKQNPDPNAKVKEGRTIYLWLNASVPPMVEVPDLAGKQSLDMALIKLENRGLVVGDIIERPSEERNAVLEVIIAGKRITEKTYVPKGTVIDLVIGGGIGSTRLRVPCLLGKTLSEVKFTAMAYDLNIGLIRYESSGLTDTASAVVYKQFPACGDGTIRVGEAIDVFFIQDLPDSIVEQIERWKFESMVEEEILRSQQN